MTASQQEIDSAQDRIRALGYGIERYDAAQERFLVIGGSTDNAVWIPVDLANEGPIEETLAKHLP